MSKETTFAKTIFMSDNSNTKSVVLSFVFNSPVLVPWSVVEKHQDNPEDATEAILLWLEAKREGNRFRENDSVCEMNNPNLKMTIRRIIRQTVNEGMPTEKKRLIGMECYWWSTADEAMSYFMQMLKRGRSTPGSFTDEEAEKGIE